MLDIAATDHEDLRTARLCWPQALGARTGDAPAGVFFNLLVVSRIAGTLCCQHLPWLGPDVATIDRVQRCGSTAASAAILGQAWNAGSAVSFLKGLAAVGGLECRVRAQTHVKIRISRNGGE